jgi:hypothetical protein
LPHARGLASAEILADDGRDRKSDRYHRKKDRLHDAHPYAEPRLGTVPPGTADTGNSVRNR